MSKDDSKESVGAWEQLEINERAGGVRLSVHVRPRSARSAVLGVRERALDIALTAPPADGAANAELIRLLARVFDVRPSDVSIPVGASGRSKLVQVNGIEPGRAREQLSRARR